MDEPTRALVVGATGANAITKCSSLQSLWSGYGEIVRCTMDGGQHSSVIVKFVAPPQTQRHPRGWAGKAGHERKLRSYDVEMAVYRNFELRTRGHCRIPRPLRCEKTEAGWVFVLEDLDAAGFNRRCDALTHDQMNACLQWLATWHAIFVEVRPQGLWKTGTYWHLATRRDEWEVMGDARLKRAATALDARLNGCRYQTLVHGDAKVANFCFPERGRGGAGGGGEVAAVDFQYTGGGCGMKDVAYFLSSSLDEGECQAQAAGWLDVYFGFLREALGVHQVGLDAGDLEDEWRTLYPVAWADFLRFLSGWAPRHYKVHGYSRRMADVALRGL